MAAPVFYLEPRKTKSGLQAINMFYSVNGSRLQYYTGQRINPKYYLTTKTVVKKDSNGKATNAREVVPTDRSKVDEIISASAPGAKLIVSKLKRLGLKAQELKDQAEANGIPVTKQYLTEELDSLYKKKEKQEIAEPLTETFVSFFRKIIESSKDGTRTLPKGKRAGQRYTHNAIKNYGITLSAIERYIEANPPKGKTLQFTDINKSFYNKFKMFCYDDEGKEPSTFGGFVKYIKIVMNEAAEQGLHSNTEHKSPSFLKPSYESDTIYLSWDQIDKIAALDLSNEDAYVLNPVPVKDMKGKVIYGKNKERIMKDEKIYYPSLEKCRDLALVGFYTGLRYGNFANLELNSIEDRFIKVKQVKTGTRITIPIMEKLKPVLARYPKGLPTLSNTKFNIYIKHIARLAGLTEEVEIKNYKGNTLNIEVSPLWKLVGSHDCRRSYCTNMFRMGMPTMLIMGSSGHKTELSFLRYIRATNEDKAELMAEQMKKLGL